MAQSSITFTTDETMLALVTEAMCATYGYQATLPDGTANPQTPAQFAQQCIIKFCQEVVLAYQTPTATQAAQAQVQQQLQAQIDQFPVTVTTS